jgi:hypothetical protein
MMKYNRYSSLNRILLLCIFHAMATGMHSKNLVLKTKWFQQEKLARPIEAGVNQY